MDQYEVLRGNGPVQGPRSWGAASVVSLIAACLAVTGEGCGANEAKPREVALPASPAPSAHVARFRSGTLKDLRDAIRKAFGEGPFRPGQTLPEEPDPDAGTGDIPEEELPGELVLAFEKARLDRVSSPVIAHQAKSGAVRFMQLGPEGEDEVSLVAGRDEGNDSVPNYKLFRIEQRWVSRLVEWDTCTRAVAGDTLAAKPCGYEGCPILMTRQRFVHPSGEIEQLLFELSNDHPEDVVEKHQANHVRSSKHCNAVTDQFGKCTLDCEQTAK